MQQDNVRRHLLLVQQFRAASYQPLILKQTRRKTMAHMIVYVDGNFEGAAGDFNQDLPNVGSFWNDTITSARVISGTWQVFEHENYTGRNVTLPPGDYPNLPISPGGIDNDSISSVRIVG
jgi:Beta/Gamma crystallin